MAVETIARRWHVGTPGGGRWIIAHGSMGCYVHPDADPAHRYHVEHWRGSRSEGAETHLSLPYALAAPAQEVPEPIKAAVRKLYADAGLPIPTTED